MGFGRTQSANMSAFLLTDMDGSMSLQPVPAKDRMKL
jgi:hypothetical protein